MAKSTRSQQIKGRKTREFSERETRRNTKVVAKVFLDLAKQFEQDNKQYFAAKNPFKILLGKFSRSMKKALFQIYSTTAGNTGGFVNTLYGWKLADDTIKAISSKVLQEYNSKYLAKRVKSITNTTRNRINNIMAKGQKEGLNNREIAKILQKEIKGMSQGRARTIARTETFDSIQNTSNATAQEAGIKNKTWLHTHGGKTVRDNHVAIDGVIKKMNQKFDLGNEMARYPHDPNLSAGNKINCYCVAVYE